MILPLLIVVSGLIAYHTADGGTRGSDRAIVTLLPDPLKGPLNPLVIAGVSIGSGFPFSEADGNGHYHIPNVPPGSYTLFANINEANVMSPIGDLELKRCQNLLPGFSSNRKVHCEPVTIVKGDDVEINWTAH